MSNVTTLSTSTKPAPITWVESLFGRMEAMYGSKFLDMWRGADVEMVKALWAEEMGKLSSEELKRGYGMLMQRDWPPSLPEYVKMCKPTVDPMVAYYEALAGIQSRAAGEIGKWSHPAIFWAAMPLSFDLGNQTYSQMRGRWEKSLADQMARGEWADIPNVMLALAAPGKSLLSKDEALQRLGELGAAAVLKIRKEDTAWYRKIFAREKSADKTLTMLQKRLAHEAAAAHGYHA